MKKLLLFTLLMSSSVYAQTVQERFEAFVCDCFTEKEKEFQTSKDLDVLDVCFNFPMEDYEEEFKALVAKKYDTTKVDSREAGRLYGTKMFSDLQTKLINDCDPYYQVMLTTGEIMQQNMQIGVSEAKIDSLTSVLKEAPHLYNVVWERGACHMSLGNSTKAISDFERCLEIEPEFPPALFFLGWVHDLNGDFENAKTYYQKVLDLESDLMGFHDVTLIKMAIIDRNAKK